MCNFLLLSPILLSLLALLVQCETIHFTNSPTQLLKKGNFSTYHLEVPGAHPITVIEANDGLNDRYVDRSRLVTKHDFIESSSSSVTSPEAENFNSQEESVENDNGNDSRSKKTVYSPDLLNKFLKDYAEKLKNADVQTKEKLNEIVAANKSPYPSEDENIRLYDFEHGERKSYFNSGPKKGYPFNTNEGWVTLDAVPWSESKVSRWQPNRNKYNKPSYNINYDQNQHNINSQNVPSYAAWNSESNYNSPPRPSKRPSSPTYIEDDEDYDEEPYRPVNKPYKPPSYQRPPHNNQRPPPLYSSRPNSEFDNDYRKPYYEGDSWMDHGFKGEIIVDSSPVNFPKYENFNDRVYNKRPNNYPQNGDGEWVLVSTTKGFQYPKRNGQRAMTFTPATTTSHKTVKLTVLPAKDANDMTTAHNGLIEVSTSQQTVEESASQDHQQKPLVSKLPKKRRKSSNLRMQMINNDDPVDTSALVAAVGAGMVPATMAFLAPMVLG